MGHHINLARWILQSRKLGGPFGRRQINLDAFDRFNELLLDKSFQTTVNHCLMQLRFCFEMLGPYPLA